MEQVLTADWKEGMTGAPQSPTADGLPLVGSLMPMLNDPVGFLVDQHRKLGPVFRVKALHRQFTVLAGVEANRFMIKHGDKYLSGKDSWTTFADEVDSKYFLAAIDGKEHAAVRKVLKKPYSKQLEDLIEILDTIDHKNCREHFHDAVYTRKEATGKSRV